MARDNPSIRTSELLDMVPDAEAARLYLEERRWHGSPTCPLCGTVERVTARTGKRTGYYRCHDCAGEFTVRTGTIFERSHVPLNKWINAMYLVVMARKGVSSLELSKQIGVTQKTAWFMLGRLREAIGDDDDMQGGVVEADGTHVGGKETKNHESKLIKAGRGPVGKAPVLRMRERGGKSKAQPIAETDGGTLRSTIEQHVNAKHLERHVNEATLRLNKGSVHHHTSDRLPAFAESVFSARIA